MKIASLPSMPAPKGLEKLSGCLLFGFVLCLLATLPVASQADSLTPFSAPLKDYAEFRFNVPSDIAVEEDVLAEANYTGGREVKATIFVNGSRVSVHLLYPCQAPAALLDSASIKAAIDAYNPAMAQAVYNPAPLNVSGQSALWGQVSNQIFVLYQPSVQTVALVLIDDSLDENTMEYLLGSLQINIKEGSTPLWPGFCPDSSGLTETNAPSQDATAKNAMATGSNMLENLKSGGMKSPAEPKVETGKERMSSDLQAAQERLAALKK
jgi:hypothetical protein